MSELKALELKYNQRLAEYESKLAAANKLREDMRHLAGEVSFALNESLTFMDCFGNMHDEIGRLKDIIYSLDPNLDIGKASKTMISLEDKDRLVPMVRKVKNRFSAAMNGNMTIDENFMAEYLKANGWTVYKKGKKNESSGGDAG